jgi:hypothetical protein
MRAYVLTDAALTKQAGRFAWLTIDSEKSKNTAFVEKFPVDALPMFLVIDPKTEKALLKWTGSATAPQLGRLLDDGERAFKGGGNGPDAALARADRLNGEGKPNLHTPVNPIVIAQAYAGLDEKKRGARLVRKSLRATLHRTCDSEGSAGLRFAARRAALPRTVASSQTARLGRINRFECAW